MLPNYLTKKVRLYASPFNNIRTDNLFTIYGNLIESVIKILPFDIEKTISISQPQNGLPMYCASPQSAQTATLRNRKQQYPM